MARIQALTDIAERAAFRAGTARLSTPEELDAFFAEIDARHGDADGEDDWEVHRARIERSRLHGRHPDGDLEPGDLEPGDLG